MTPTENPNPIVLSNFDPERFAESVAERLRNLHTRPVLQGRKETPMSEKFIAEVKKDIIPRCVKRGERGDPQAKL